MKHAKNSFKRFMSSAEGATAIEYGLIAAAMGLMLIPAMSSLSATAQGTLYGVIQGLFAP
jgi:pilus assembly protein Flp/PilA